MPDQEWIRCSKRKPAEGQECSVTIRANGGNLVSNAEFEDGWFVNWDWTNVNQNMIVAWMPSPTPYLGEK